jgi:hypothetical protein
MLKIVILFIIYSSSFFYINSLNSTMTDNKLWKSVSVSTTAKPSDVWNIYSKLIWQVNHIL